MGRDLQKKKRRSGKQPIRQTQRPKKAPNPLGNNIIARNWNKKETLTQNYRRLGLVSKLGKFTGGTERSVENPTVSAASGSDLLRLPSSMDTVVRETKVERDAEGRIVRVVDGRRDNPLGDPLAYLDSDSEDDDGNNAPSGGQGQDDSESEWQGIDDGVAPKVVKELELEARRPEVKRPRHQSEREREWLQKLVAKHGDDYRAMEWDKRLNPMQQTAADIRKRIRRSQIAAG